VVDAILKTLAYADIFDYPLTFEQIVKFLIGKRQIERKVVQKNLKILADRQQIYTDGEFYCLRERNNVIEVRKKKERWSKEKFTIARKTAEKLKFLRWVKIIGITGALAMGNPGQEDDIDLIVVTSANRLWLTRLLIFFLCPVLGIRRRKPGEKNVKNKICFNLFLDENHLKISLKNLFLAHEICQVKPLINKDRTYDKFLWENRWVRDYLPNAVKIMQYRDNRISKNHLIVISLYRYLDFLNKIAFFLQYQYMKPKITNEKVSLHQAFFHPRNLGRTIEAAHEKKLIRLGLDKFLKGFI